MKTNTDLDKLDDETKEKIINDFKSACDEYYKTELPKKIEKLAAEEVNFENAMKWFSKGFSVAALLVALIVVIIRSFI